MKNNLKLIAADTLDVLEGKQYTNQDNVLIDISQELELSIRSTRTFTPEELEKMSEAPLNGMEHPTTYRVINETSLNAVRLLHSEGKYNPMCLNFASAKNHGGGFINGASAQEESIARASGLYPTLLTGTEYYSTHREMKSCTYTDHMIYSPSVPVFKYEDGSYMAVPVLCTFITAAAVNKGVVAEREPELIPQVEELMRKRAEKVLTLAAYHGHRYLVLGAWGCGVFRNDPAMVAEIFAGLLGGKFINCFREVVFAVKTNQESVIAPFFEHFQP